MATLKLDYGGALDGFPRELELGSNNGDRARGKVIDRLEKAAQHMLGRRPVMMPGYGGVTYCDENFDKVYTFYNKIQPFTGLVQLRLAYSTLNNTDEVTISVVTPEGTFAPSAFAGSQTLRFAAWNLEMADGLVGTWTTSNLEESAVVTLSCVNNNSGLSAELYIYSLVIIPIAQAELTIP